MKRNSRSRARKGLAFALLALVLVVAGATALGAADMSGAQSLYIPSIQKDAAAPVPAYPVVDTNQRKCYDNSGEIACPSAGQAFYGQDAQTTVNSPSFTVSTDGQTVNDNVTGLTWERSPETNGDGVLNKADKLTYANALTHCSSHASAGYQGYTDWRLPAIKELYSLIDFRGTDPAPTAIGTAGLTPFIDRTYFAFAYGDTSAGERVIDSQYASSTLYVANNNMLFGVNFADGRIKGYGLTMPGGAVKTFFVQCVRGNTSYGKNNFVDNRDGTITDAATGLMWAQADSGSGMTWQSALAWVQSKNAVNYLGHNDWRLPDTKELQSIVDYTRSPDTTGSAAINSVFKTTSLKNEQCAADYPWYWSSTTHAASTGSGSAGVYVSFGRAMGFMNNAWSDIHGAGAQRSDPKSDVLNTYAHRDCGYYNTNAPQSDSVRVYNYVRLVRTSGAATPPPAATPSLTATSTRVPPTATRTTVPTSTATRLPPPLPPGPGQTPPPPPQPPSNGGMTITGTLSDQAQSTTIAFDGLGFLTGNLGADSFFPPGKVADFWGFQYLRDNDPSAMGHNTDFLTKASLNMLTVLTASQRTELIALAQSQVAPINQYALKRFVLMDAFRRLLSGTLPTGTTGLDLAAVQAYSTDLYKLDGEISYARAQVMGKQISQFTASQRVYLDAMVGKGMLDWPSATEPAELQGLAHDVKVAVMTYAGDMFSWYAGSLTADVYFCPERQGTYFGSFYLKDAPAVGNPGYSIPVTMTAEMGQKFLGTLTFDQSLLITSLVDAQKPALQAIVDRRTDIATQLRRFMKGETPDPAQIQSLMQTYGALDGEIIYRYANAFAQVGHTLTDAQRTALLALRTQILGNLSLPSGAYLYSDPIAMPAIPSGDFLFGKGAAPAATATSVPGTGLPPPPPPGGPQRPPRP